MSTDNKKENDIFGRVEADDEDIFKSAIESPMTDSTERTLHGDEIDLNDEDEDNGIGFPSPIPKRTIVETPSVRGTIDLGNRGGDKKSLKNGVNSQSNSDTEDSRSKVISKESNQPDQSPSFPPETDLTHSSVDLVSQPARESDSNVGNKSSVATSAEKMQDGQCDGQYVEITVTDPHKQGDGMSGFMVYRVTTKTNISIFRRKEFAVWRRFSDFLGLHSKLAEKYLKKGRIVPPAPEKNMLGTTKIKMSSGQADPNAPSEFIEKRRSELERFMVRSGVHPILRLDPDFRDFLEIDSDLPKSTNTSAFSGAGVVRLISKVGETVTKISYKMDENDSWFEEKTQNIEALENQLRKVYNSVELLVTNRKDLALAAGIFAKSAAILSNAEEHTSLSRILSQLAEVEEKMEQMHHDQANADFYLFAELLKDYVALISSVKEVFHERIKAYQLWQSAQQTLNKKRETKTKWELQLKNDKLAQAREDVVEWEGKVERCEEDFKTISIVIKKELEQFEIARVKEFKSTIIKYLESLLHQQQELVKYWEAFLPEFKALTV